jgi:DNA-binding response OmpR family regulator
MIEAAELLRAEIDELFDGARGTSPSADGVKVVLIDDDDEARELLKLTLAKAEYSVRDASGGSEALQLIQADRPALVVLDWHMPDQSGALVLEELKGRWPDVPVIMLTGESRLSVRAQAEAQGADAFLLKPFRKDELLETIERVLAARA